MVSKSSDVAATVKKKPFTVINDNGITNLHAVDAKAAYESALKMYREIGEPVTILFVIEGWPEYWPAAQLKGE
jgi:hypothetical protein